MRISRLVVVSLAVVLLAMAPPSPEYGDTIRRAQQALEKQDLTTALALLDRTILIAPDSPTAFVLLGQVYMGLERYADASTALGRGAGLAGGMSTPEGKGALNMLALSLAREERSTEALALLDQLLAAGPVRPALWLLRGNVHLAMGEPDLAKPDFEREIQLYGRAGVEGGAPPPPRSPLAAAWAGLGICAYRLGDDELAFKALSLVPEAQDARYHLGLTLARMGRHAEALDAFREVIARSPQDRGALQGLARSAGALGREDDRRRALATLSALYRLDEERRSAKVRISSLRTRAFAKAQAGDFRGAIAELEAGVQIAPQDAELRLDFGRILSEAGERRRGEAVLRELIAQNSMNAEAHYRLGRLLLSGNDAQAASIPFETACRIAPMNASYHVALGQAYLEVKKYGEGIDELRLARKLAPEDPECSYSLGMGLARTGALREAVEELEAAVSQDRADPRPHQALAELYARLGDTERSRREQEAARRLASQPGSPS
jgi:tetratricopeptide (TPR) repeat protein